MICNAIEPTSHILLVYPYDIIQKLYYISENYVIARPGLVIYNPLEVNLWDRLVRSYNYSIQTAELQLHISRLIRFLLFLVTVPLFKTNMFSV